MNANINFHPSPEMLREFANGSLSTGLSVAVSAHVQLCETCRARSSEQEARATIDWLQESAQEMTPQSDQDLAAMLDVITALPQQREERQEACVETEIHMHERSVKLPRVLAKIAADGLVWKKLAGGINQAAVRLDEKTQCEFIYMKPGSQVPIHPHDGHEITLVLDGSFRDELGEYQPRDFVVRDASHNHQPTSEEGCLCFAVLDSPLRFTRGPARLLNPFLRYKFRRATA